MSRRGNLGDEFQALRGSQEVRDRAGIPIQYKGPSGALVSGRSLIERTRPGPEESGRSARGPRFHALILFLNLIEGDAARLTEILLAHSNVNEMHAYWRAIVSVNVLSLFRR